MFKTFRLPFSATQKCRTCGLIKKPCMRSHNCPLIVELKGVSFDNTIWYAEWW